MNRKSHAQILNKFIHQKHKNHALKKEFLATPQGFILILRYIMHVSRTLTYFSFTKNCSTPVWLHFLLFVSRLWDRPKFERCSTNVDSFNRACVNFLFRLQNFKLDFFLCRRKLALTQLLKKKYIKRWISEKKLYCIRSNSLSLFHAFARSIPFIPSINCKWSAW